MNKHIFMKGKTQLLNILLYLLCLIPTNSLSKELDNKKEILFISSYSVDNEYSKSNITSFISTFSQLQGEYIFATEPLNCLSLADRYRWVEDTRKIMQRHKNSDLVVLMGTEAIISFLSLDKQEINDVPIFAVMGQRYCARMNGNEIPALYSKNNDNDLIDILAVAKRHNLKLFYFYDYKIKKDIDLIKHCFPKTQNIIVLSDNSINGLSHLRQIESEVKKNFASINLKYIDGRYINTEQATDLFSKIPQKSAVILCGWKYDKNSIAHMDNNRVSFIEANPNVPVFSLTGTGLGSWAIGGYLPQYRPLGEELAKKAFELLETDEWKGPYISGYSEILKLDFNEFKRWNLLNVKLPTDVVFVNPECGLKDYFSQYKWYFILGLGIFILITVGFIYTTISNFNIRRLKFKLEKKDKYLEEEKNELIKYQKELIIAKEKADEFSKLQSSFVSNISHEIRTPLNAIVGFSDVLLSTIEPTKEQKEYISIIKHNSSLLLKLISDILDLSRIDAKMKPLFFENADIIPLLESTVISMRPTANENVQILFTHEEDSINIVTDLVRLQQIVINLIGNAIKFTDKGNITLNVERKSDQEMIEFSVTDTGSGIPIDKQDKVFERFCKINEFVQGTGLGLAICEAIIKQFGGKIWIDKSYSTGARFIFTLPTNHKVTNDEE